MPVGEPRVELDAEIVTPGRRLGEPVEVLELRQDISPAALSVLESPEQRPERAAAGR
jgi:hypothetical protein